MYIEVKHNTGKMWIVLECGYAMAVNVSHRVLAPTCAVPISILKHDFSVLTDYSIDAPPSLKPAKKYSDISGLPVSNDLT